MTSPAQPLARPLLAQGAVRHARLRPVSHAFSYANYFWLLPMRALAMAPEPVIHRNRWGMLSFHDRDHGDGGMDALAWLDQLLASSGHGLEDAARGEVWLQTFPRVLGFAFKPVSFWYVHRADDSLHAIVAEVNNTFGERHCYVLAGPDVAWGSTLQSEKVFHVSPFCEARGQYRFRFMRTADRIVARVEHLDEQGPLITTSQSGVLTRLTSDTARRAFWRTPMMTWGVVWRIHVQAWALWRKKVPFFRKPAPPVDAVTVAMSPPTQTTMY